MKRIVSITLLLSSVFVQAQRFDWVTSAGYAGVANSYYGAVAIARDSQGNIYTLDGANGQQQCQGVTAEPYAGGITTFLYKFNASGELQYIKPIGVNFYPLNIQVGENDNLYLLGALWGTSTLIVDGVTINGIANRNYILKFDPSGNLLWNVPNNESFGGHSAACMLQFHDNHIYFQSGSLSVSKLDIAGQFISTLTADAFVPYTAINSIYFKGSGVFSNGDLFFSATSRGTLTYDTTTLVPLIETGTAPLLMLRTNNNLNFGWASYVNGAGNPAENFIPLTIGNDNGIYVGVEVNSTIIAGTDTITNPGPGSTNYTDGILKLDETGTPIWIKSVTTNAHAWSLLNNPDGSGVFCGGDFTGELTLGNFTINAINGRSYITKIDYDGTFQNAFAFVSGNEMGSKVNSMATNNEGVFYVGGKLSGISNPVFSCIPRDSNRGLYLGKFTEEPDAAPQPAITISGSMLTASPVFNGNIQWFYNGDSIPDANSQSYTVTANGNYSVSYSYVPACVSISDQISYSSVGVPENELQSFALYPNPFRNEVIIETKDASGPAIVTVLDMSGRVLYIENLETGSKILNLSFLQDGIYIVQLRDSRGVVSKILIKKQ
ncbi:MAG: hypothetical protein FD170_3861 [Bacteroidetes bacterium]|nr:MAG: hypothetical protein FD170_3861 [Bacteroidota bacterium]